MEMRDGFIGGIHNYCDRWCETCAFTSWCRLFADVAQAHAARDQNLKAVVDAPLLPQDVPPEPAPSVRQLLEELDSGGAALPQEDVRPFRPEFDRDDHHILVRARDYFTRVHRWLRDREDVGRDDPSDPRAVIAWFSSLVPAKIGRALSGLAWVEAGDVDDPRDYDGSAKVALIGIDRSHAAWLQLAEGGQTDVDSFIADLVWMGDALERLFPRARTFVRPAFDEPEEVAQLVAEPF
jgi:hypothetical protein